MSAKPERYLSATLRILLCVWLKLTSKNWACRSSSSSCSLVLGLIWNSEKYLIVAPSWCKSIATEVLSNYLFCHHLKKDSKHFISNTNNALHHPCGNEERLRTWTTLKRYSWNRHQVPTRLVFLNGFVFKVTKHDLEPVRVIGSQHPETEEAEVHVVVVVHM